MKQEKKQLREKLIQIRLSLSPLDQSTHAQKVAQFMENLPAFQDVLHLGFYFPIQGELSPIPLLNIALKAQKYCYLPIVTPHKSLRFFRVDAQTAMTQNRYGIFEPEPSPLTEIKPQDLEMVFLPLVGFDEKCQRLGMGGAYYDRTFSFRHTQTKPLLIGLAHDCQGIKSVPQNDFDVKLDMVVSEKKIYTKE